MYNSKNLRTFAEIYSGYAEEMGIASKVGYG
jgi:hypothetical protein